MRYLSTIIALCAGVFASSAHAATTYRLTCDIGGVASSMVSTVEIINSHGIVVGPGFSPDIKVISAGDSTVYSSGEIRNQHAHYVFNGVGEYADVVEMGTGQRFRIRFELTQGGLYIITNPFEGSHGYEGSGRYLCKTDG